jgi:hypothetical protein
MRNILKYGIISFVMAFGLILVNVDTANAQNRRYANREYRRDVREAQRDYERRMREGNYYKAEKEYREDLRDARRERAYNVRRDRYGWYYMHNGRRINRPFGLWSFRGGFFYRNN